MQEIGNVQVCLDGNIETKISKHFDDIFTFSMNLITWKVFQNT